MTATPRILVFAGSTRVDSYNRKLARAAAEALRAAEAEVTLLDLRELPMPLYDGDLEKAEGLPANAKRFKQALIAHPGFLICSPEYNSSISGVLKNALDWASRPEPEEESLVAFKGKVASLLAASPGALGGLRGLVTVRSILSNIGVIVLPEQLAVPQAHLAFADDGSLKEPRQQAALARIAGALAVAVARLHPG